MRTHPKHDAIARLLREGLSNGEIGRRLHTDRHAVARIRRGLGLPNIVQRVQTLDEKWAANTRAADGGHVEWTGERGSSSGTPVMRYREQSYSPAAVAFRMRTGRDAQGYVKAECGVKHCVAPAHVQDEAERLAARAELHPGPLTGRCRYGHERAEHGRFEPDGTAYCARCKYLAKFPDKDDRALLPEVQPLKPARSWEEAFRRYAQPVDGGHLVWGGTRANGTPVVSWRGTTVTAARLALRLHTGREPEGRVTRACDVPLCVAGPCLQDRPMRERTNELFAAIFGVAA
ncbi:hypothetical protein [Streptomyces indicus]|uniref:Uncharacterized protein n=1 Tax=Streptomyces indicus TaxID=417292 RepID=A0A1G9J8R3_9ACTN|nr:hypothetical protein [Streptomyces indicus]SDL33534.1 hypothetical protein SAMN05421806_12834 [Streptomyces indicus]